jgi:hypothetical protein
MVLRVSSCKLHCASNIYVCDDVLWGIAVGLLAFLLLVREATGSDMGPQRPAIFAEVTRGFLPHGLLQLFTLLLLPLR